MWFSFHSKFLRDSAIQLWTANCSSLQFCAKISLCWWFSVHLILYFTFKMLTRTICLAKVFQELLTVACPGFPNWCYCPLLLLPPDNDLSIKPICSTHCFGQIQSLSVSWRIKARSLMFVGFEEGSLKIWTAAYSAHQKDWDVLQGLQNNCVVFGRRSLGQCSLGKLYLQSEEQGQVWMQPG